jgi:hypothetical protein
LTIDRDFVPDGVEKIVHEALPSGSEHIYWAFQDGILVYNTAFVDKGEPLRLEGERALKGDKP